MINDKEMLVSTAWNVSSIPAEVSQEWAHVKKESRGPQHGLAISSHLTPATYSTDVQLRREEDPWLARPPCRSDPAITSHSTILPVAKKKKNFFLLLVVDLDLSVVYILSYEKQTFPSILHPSRGSQTRRRDYCTPQPPQAPYW